jgi:hypothetical protein
MDGQIYVHPVPWNHGPPPERLPGVMLKTGPIRKKNWRNTERSSGFKLKHMISQRRG